MILKGKVALITGCNRGIGRAIMKLFMEEGCNIVACTRKLTPEMVLFYEDARKIYNVDIRPLFFELSDDDAIKAAMKELMSWKISIDILVNNAGVASGGYLALSSIKQIKDVFQINYFAQVLITQYVTKLMMREKSGSVIFMSSVMGLDTMPGGSAYGASKAAIALLTKSLAKELGVYCIRVNAIAPNLIETDMAHQMEQKSFDNMVNGTALKRLGNPSEIAYAALYLASESSSFITGQILRVDGGL